MDRLNVAVIGVGGVGGYFGGRLAHAFSSGPDSSVKIFFIARGKHLDAIREDGLLLKSPQCGEIRCRPAQAVERIGDLPPMDIFLLAVKGYDLIDVARSMKDLIRQDTFLLPLLNGADIHERLRREIETGIILPACVYVSSYIEKPGVVVHIGNPGKIIFGRDPDHPDAVPSGLLRIFEKSSIDFEWRDDANPAIWEKYLFIASFGLVTAYYDRTFGEILDDASLREEVIQIMKEICSIASKRDIRLPDGIVDLSLKKAATFPRDTRTSLQRDIHQKKGKSELELFGGTIIDLGKRLDVPTPVTLKLYRALGGA